MPTPLEQALRRSTCVCLLTLASLIITWDGASALPTIGDYLLIGLGPVNSDDGRPGVGQAVNINNFEIGANKAPVPSQSGFASGSSGPGIRGNAPNIPNNAQSVGTGITFDGNVAITHRSGVFNFQDLGVYANPAIGIQCAQSASNCDVGTSNSFFNDPNQYPNTFVPSGTGAPTNKNVDGSGVFVNPNNAVQSTRIDKPNSAGVTGNVDFSPLLGALSLRASTIPGMPATGTLNLTNSGGKLTKEIDSFSVSGTIVVTDVQINDGRPGSFGDNTSVVGNTRIQLAPGPNVIDIITGGQNFLLQESSLIIDGPAGAQAIFRVPDTANFLVSNANILVGTGGIGLDDILFYSDRPDSNAHFDFSNSVVNGVAFWSLGASGGEIGFDDVQGCTQLVADKINLSDVRLSRCAFAPGAPVPEPSSIILFSAGLIGTLVGRFRRSLTPKR